VRALTVVKFASAYRSNSYRDGRFHEQAAASRRLERRSFVAREVLTAAALAPLRSRLAPGVPIDPSLAAKPGGVVTHYRRIRGLE
jgi:hypothetical protein